jgi:hypothetical protein
VSSGQVGGVVVVVHIEVAGVKFESGRHSRPQIAPC